MAVEIAVGVKLDEVRSQLRKLPGMTDDAIKKAMRKGDKRIAKNERLQARKAKNFAKRQAKVAASVQKNYEHAFRSSNALIGPFMGDIEDLIELTGGLAKTFTSMGPAGMAAGAGLAVAATSLIAIGATAATIGITVHQVENLTKANRAYAEALGMSRAGNEKAIQVSKDMHAAFKLVGVMFTEIGIRISQDFAPEIEYGIQVFAGSIATALDFINRIPEGFMTALGTLKLGVSLFTRLVTLPLYLIVKAVQGVAKAFGWLSDYVLGTTNAMSKALHGVADGIQELDNGLTDLTDAGVDMLVGAVEIPNLFEDMAAKGREVLPTMNSLMKAEKGYEEALRKANEERQRKLNLEEQIRGKVIEGRNANLDAIDAMARAVEAEQSTSGDSALDAIQMKQAKLRELVVNATADYRQALREGGDLGEIQDQLIQAADIQIHLEQQKQQRLAEIQQAAADQAAKLRDRQAAEDQRALSELIKGREDFAKASVSAFMSVADAAGASSETMAAAKLLETIAFQAVAVARAFAEGGPFAGPIAAATAIGTIGAQIANLASASGNSAPTSGGSGGRSVQSPSQVAGPRSISERGTDGGAPLVVVSEYSGKIYDAAARDSQKRRGSPLQKRKALRRARRNG